MKLPAVFRKKSTYTLMGSIKAFWILTGIILLMVGIWFISLYFMFQPYVGYILQNTTDRGVYDRVRTTMTALPLLGGGCFLFAIFQIWTAAAFRKFKKWALTAVSVMSYAMIMIAGVGCIGWVKAWQFAMQYGGPAAGTPFWSYFGMFIGLVAGLFYIAMIIFYIKATANKEFRNAYHKKIIN